MRLLVLPTTDPHFNLAAEEYLFHTAADDIFMLWQNRDSIIVGKNQNTWAEIDLDRVTRDKIPVVRRITGGGAVFHDLGNFNFTFIMKRTETAQPLDFHSFLNPIVGFLHTYRIPAQISGRNDLEIDGKKFSGNAQCANKTAVLHHGTLLFQSDLEKLSEYLTVDPQKIQTKGIPSVKSRVTNLSEYFPTDYRPQDFLRELTAYIAGDTAPDTLSEREHSEILRLKQEKYDTWQWNFGQSPSHTFRKKQRFSAGGIDVYMQIENGTVTSAKIFGDFFSANDLAQFETGLCGLPHEKTAFRAYFDTVPLQSYFIGISTDELITCFF